MIQYRYLTLQQAQQWQALHPADTANPLSDFHLEHFNHLHSEDVIAVIALDENEIVGRNLLSYCEISVAGEPINCIVSQRVYVKEEYRTKGVGVYVKMHLLRLGLPQLSSSVSAAMQKVYDSWGEYHRVDDSPIHSIPLTTASFLRDCRLDYYAQISNGENTGWLFLARHMLHKIKAATRLSLLPSGQAGKLLNGTEACSALEEIVNLQKLPIYTPWDKKKIKSALAGSEQGMKAWVYKTSNQNKTTPYLLTAYIKYKATRVVGNQREKLKELHVNEIFPPVENKSDAIKIIHFVRKLAKTLSFDTVHIYAMTSELQQACHQLQLASFYNKSVYIVLRGVNEAQASLLIDPNNWWCRAINEEQFEESYCTQRSPCSLPN